MGCVGGEEAAFEVGVGARLFSGEGADEAEVVVLEGGGEKQEGALEDVFFKVGFKGVGLGGLEGANDCGGKGLEKLVVGGFKFLFEVGAVVLKLLLCSFDEGSGWGCGWMGDELFVLEG